MVDSLGTINYSTEGGYQKAFSERTGALIDKEVREIINEQYKACHETLEANRDKIEALAQVLLEKETLSLPDIVDTLGQRPFPLKQNILDYLHELREREEVTTEATAEDKDDTAFQSDASEEEDAAEKEAEPEKAETKSDDKEDKK